VKLRHDGGGNGAAEAGWPVDGPVIRMRGVHKRFGDQVVLDGVDFDVHQGETLVILGPSGTGKSVLLRHIVGLTLPDFGSVRVLGRELVGLPRAELYPLRLRIGVLFQGAALLDSMTVRDNIVLGLRTHFEYGEAELRRIAAEKLEQVGLPGIGDQMPAELSGGMRKRVGLARAIAMDPSIILYDEPTTGLDPIMSAVIDELILAQARRPGVTSVIVTHDMRSAYHLGTRFLLLQRGRIRFDGDAEALRSSPDPLVQGFISGRAEAADLLQ
jgi:phospholipid/cholesterol/gamma-HCH transport system ATP-binding protein